MFSCSVWFCAPSFWDGWWSWESLRRSCVRCGWCRATPSYCLFLNFHSTCQYYCMIPSDCSVCIVWLTSLQISVKWTCHFRVTKIGAKLKRNPVLGVVCVEGNCWVRPYPLGYFIWIGNVSFVRNCLRNERKSKKNYVYGTVHRNYMTIMSKKMQIYTV